MAHPPAGRNRWRILVAGCHVPLAVHAVKATTFAARLQGLLGRDALPEGEAMIFERCHSIHTIGMRFSIDAVFVDRQWRIVGLYREVGPGRLVASIWSAWGVIETTSGTVARLGLHVGDQLQVVTG